MKEKEIKEMLRKKMKAIEKLSFTISKDFDQELIHSFRLSLKSLHSFLRLLETCSNKIKYNIPKKLKRLYDIAGVIRESALEKELLHKMQVSIPRYIDFLDSMVSKKKSEWKRYYKRKVIRNASKKITAHKYKALHIETLNRFFITSLLSLKNLKGSAADSRLHEVRKDLTDMLHIEKFIDNRLWIAAQPPDQFTKNQLKGLAQTLGNYNDERITLKHLSDFPLAVLNNEEKVALKQFRDVEKKKLKLEKKKLFKTMLHNVQDTIKNFGDI